MSGCAAEGQREAAELKWWFRAVDYGDSLNMDYYSDSFNVGHENFIDIKY